MVKFAGRCCRLPGGGFGKLLPTCWVTGSFTLVLIGCSSASAAVIYQRNAFLGIKLLWMLSWNGEEGSQTSFSPASWFYWRWKGYVRDKGLIIFVIKTSSFKICHFSKLDGDFYFINKMFLIMRSSILLRFSFFSLHRFPLEWHSDRACNAVGARNCLQCSYQLWSLQDYLSDLQLWKQGHILLCPRCGTLFIPDPQARSGQTASSHFRDTLSNEQRPTTKICTVFDHSASHRSFANCSEISRWNPFSEFRNQSSPWWVWYLFFVLPRFLFGFELFCGIQECDLLWSLPTWIMLWFYGVY